MSSPFDQLHDRLFRSDPSKPIKKLGTRYERLMAAVQIALHENHVVVHDIQLRGESDVKHQIDVCVSSSERSASKRILIECKDLSVSDEKVGLPIVRDFSAVVDDIKPFQAMIVTCVGFTEPAVKFANHKGIRLCTLQLYDKKSDTIVAIGINLSLLWPEIKEAEFLAAEAGQVEIYKALTRAGAGGLTEAEAGVKQVPLDAETSVYVRFGNQRIQVAVHMRNLAQDFIRGWMAAGTRKFEWKSEAFLEIGNGPLIPIDGISLVVEQEATEDFFTVAGGRIAELVLRYLGEGEERVIYRDELKSPPTSGGVPEV